MHRLLAAFLVIATIAVAKSEQQSRIVGGSDAPEGKYPYQVSLQTRSHFCGGSIINKRWILTAAHCVVGQSAAEIKVVTGTISLSEGGSTYQADYLIPHKKYNALLLRNDIALIRVSEDIEFSDKVKPIPLSTSEPTLGDYGAVLSGWGTQEVGGSVPDKLQEIDLNVISVRKCKLRHWTVTKTHICTFTKRGEGACHGDSGGPLASDGQLIGVVSYGLPCAKGFPDVFTRVSQFVSWINENMETYSV